MNRTINVNYHDMRLKNIKKAISSSTPFNSTYRLIPESKRSEFKRMAARFGLTEDKIEEILERERKEYEKKQCK